MTTEDDIKEIQEEVKEMKDFPIKLSWKQVWIIITTFITVVGSAFGIGIKVEYEAQKIVQLKQEREFQKQLSLKDEDILVIKRELKETKEDIIYYSNRYDKIKERLDNCVKSNPFFKISEIGKDENN